jgi:hypothetical protein
VTDFLFAPVAPSTVRQFRALLAAFAIYAFWPRSFAPVPPAHWAAGLVALVVFGAGLRPRLSGLLAFAVLLPLGFFDRAEASRQLLLFALLATSLWSGPGPIWPLRLIQIQLSVVYGVNAVAKSTSHYLSGDALVGMSSLPNFVADFSDSYWHLGSFAVPVMAAAIATTLMEYFLAIAFWFPRLRWVAAAAGVAFHLVATTVVRIFILDLATMFLYLAFLLPFEAPAGAASPADPLTASTPPARSASRRE